MTAIDPRIVGIWQLKSTVGRDDAGKILPEPYGPLAMGLVTFQADGRMMAVLCDGRAALGGEPRQFMSYAGNYTFDGTTLSTRVDASSDASRIGGDQVRSVRFEKDAMVLAPPRRLYGGVMQHQELVWERVGA
jgi:hypothetical protein